MSVSFKPNKENEIVTITPTRVVLDQDESKQYVRCHIYGHDENSIPRRATFNVATQTAYEISLCQGILPQMEIYKEYDDKLGNKKKIDLMIKDLMAANKPFQYQMQSNTYKVMDMNGQEEEKIGHNLVFNPDQFK